MFWSWTYASPTNRCKPRHREEVNGRLILHPDLQTLRQTPGRSGYEISGRLRGKTGDWRREEGCRVGYMQVGWVFPLREEIRVMDWGSVKQSKDRWRQGRDNRSMRPLTAKWHLMAVDSGLIYYIHRRLSLDSLKIKTDKGVDSEQFSKPDILKLFDF